MPDFIATLKRWLILSYNDILDLKRQIASTYAQRDEAYRAHLLASEVHQRLDAHLLGLSADESRHVKQAVLKNCLTVDAVINKLDLLEALCRMDATSEHINARAKVWLRENTTFSLSDTELYGYIESLKPLEQANDDAELSGDLQLVFHHAKSTHPHAFALLGMMLLLLICASLWLATALKLNDAHFTLTPHVVPIISLARDNDLMLIHQVSSPEASVFELDYVAMRSPYTLFESHYTYEPFDYLALRNYLNLERDSYLIDENALNEVLLISKSNDLDPLLLLAIIGQEQGFIPRSSEDKSRIINNPFNVFHSWQSYNTTITDATQIAVNLIQKRLSEKPASADALVWLNIVYAEDPDWSKGVSSLYDTLSLKCRNLGLANALIDYGI